MRFPRPASGLRSLGVAFALSREVDRVLDCSLKGDRVELVVEAPVRLAVWRALRGRGFS